jgi:hypothetical protein
MTGSAQFLRAITLKIPPAGVLSEMAVLNICGRLPSIDACFDGAVLLWNVRRNDIRTVIQALRVFAYGD